MVQTISRAELFAFVFLIFLNSCGTSNLVSGKTNQNRNSSAQADSNLSPSFYSQFEVPYEEWPHRYQMSGFFEGEIRLCVVAGTEVTIGARNLALENASKALAAWGGHALRIFPKVKTHIKKTCKDPHYTVTIHTTENFSRNHRKDLRAYVDGKNPNRIEVNLSDLSYGLFLHEFGHAFVGLGDTYVDDASGKCKSEQPNSIMCSHYRFGTKLMTDDLNGLKNQLPEVFSSYLLVDGIQKYFLNPISQRVIVDGLKVADLKIKFKNISYQEGKPNKLYVSFHPVEENIIPHAAERFQKSASWQLDASEDEVFQAIQSLVVQ